MPIPLSKDVQINPGVLAVAGNAVDLNGLFDGGAEEADQQCCGGGCFFNVVCHRLLPVYRRYAAFSAGNT